MATTVYIGVGSNVDAERHLKLAWRALRKNFGPMHASSVYRTRAVGFEGDDFLNMVFSFPTQLAPQAIIAELAAVEKQAGRKRGAGRYAPRTLDLDLLLYGDLVSADPGLALPRRELRYGFALAPLAELAPQLRHPVSGTPFAELWAACGEDQQPLEVFTFDSLLD